MGGDAEIDAAGGSGGTSGSGEGGIGNDAGGAVTGPIGSGGCRSVPAAPLVPVGLYAAERFGAEGVESAQAATLTPSGDVVFAGTMTSSLGILPSPLGLNYDQEGVDGYVAMLHDTGDLAWARRIGDQCDIEAQRSLHLGADDAATCCWAAIGAMRSGSASRS